MSDNEVPEASKPVLASTQERGCLCRAACDSRYHGLPVLLHLRDLHLQPVHVRPCLAEFELFLIISAAQLSSQIPQFVTQTFRLPTLGVDYRLKVSARVLSMIEAIGIERYLLKESTSTLGPVGSNLRDRLLAKAKTFRQARGAMQKLAEPAPPEPCAPSATLVWYALSQMETYDKNWSGYCLRCCCSGHRLDECTVGHIQGEERFYDHHNAPPSPEGRPICGSYHLYGLCEDPNCVVGSCVACGDRHPTHEHFQPRTGRPRLPVALPAFVPEPIIPRRKPKVTDYEVIAQQEVDRAMRHDVNQVLLKKYLARAKQETEAFTSWKEKGSPTLESFADRFPLRDTFDKTRSRVLDSIPEAVRLEKIRMRTARNRRARQVARKSLYAKQES